jgi:hypothetical protein
MKRASLGLTPNDNSRYKSVTNAVPVGPNFGTLTGTRNAHDGVSPDAGRFGVTEAKRATPLNNSFVSSASGVPRAAA